MELVQLQTYAELAALAPTGPAVEPELASLTALVRGVEAMTQGDARQARLLLAPQAAGAPHRAAVALLAPWAAAQAGDAEASIVHPVLPGEPIAQFFASLDQGKLFERAHRYGEAETTFRVLIGAGDPGGIASASLGEMLERRGDWPKAVEVYDQALAHNPDDGPLKAARARAAAHGRAPAIGSIREAAAEALIAPATALMIQKQEEAALAYLRLALRLDPGRSEAWMLVGDILSDVGDVDGARAAYLRPQPDSDEFVAARGKLAWSYQNSGDADSFTDTFGYLASAADWATVSASFPAFRASDEIPMWSMMRVSCGCFSAMAANSGV